MNELKMMRLSVIFERGIPQGVTVGHFIFVVEGRNIENFHFLFRNLIEFLFEERKTCG
jgi:hypothetical protein